MAFFRNKITCCLLLFVYAWALFLGEATHRFLHHLQDSQHQSATHEHSLSCFAESAAETPSDENHYKTARQDTFNPTECAFGLALHVLLSQQGQSQFFASPTPPLFTSSQTFFKKFGPHFRLHHVSANHTRGSPLV